MFERVGFIGLGLMGGALAKSIRKYDLAQSIVAYDRNIEHLEMALSDGTINKAASAIDGTFSDCNLIFLCCPVKVNRAVMKALKPHLSPNCLITDVGSTKTDIHRVMAETAADQPFIGGHPMTGSEQTGYRHSNPVMFENIVYVLTPSPSASNEDFDKLFRMVKAIDSIPLKMQPDVHDSAAAAISHVPHIIATSLVNAVAVMDEDNGYMSTLAAGGFKDLTRIASGSPEMWEAICLANKEAILRALDVTKSSIETIQAAIEEANSQKLYEAFDEGKQYRDSFNDQVPGMLPRDHSIRVDVDDEPGIIARIATVLFEANINIKNIGIVNNRESERGILRIYFDDSRHMQQSMDILESMGYTLFH